ncbi:hypothetical protein TSO221_26450 [Azospirillum sp. TSO22-1]|nr:hypothetical protein TSO221_26450 [Azospirillum sp. TSO22-1]
MLVGEAAAVVLPEKLQDLARPVSLPGTVAGTTPEGLTRIRTSLGDVMIDLAAQLSSDKAVTLQVPAGQPPGRVQVFTNGPAGAAPNAAAPATPQPSAPAAAQQPAVLVSVPTPAPPLPGAAVPLLPGVLLPALVLAAAKPAGPSAGVPPTPPSTPAAPPPPSPGNATPTPASAGGAAPTPTAAPSPQPSAAPLPSGPPGEAPVQLGGDAAHRGAASPQPSGTPDAPPDTPPPAKPAPQPNPQPPEPGPGTPQQGKPQQGAPQPEPPRAGIPPQGSAQPSVPQAGTPQTATPTATPQAAPPPSVAPQPAAPQAGTPQPPQTPATQPQPTAPPPRSPPKLPQPAPLPGAPPAAAPSAPAPPSPQPIPEAPADAAPRPTAPAPAPEAPPAAAPLGRAPVLVQGTTVALKVVTVAPPGAPPPPLPATPPAAPLLQGTVAGTTPQGQPILATPQGMLVLTNQPPLPPGTQVVAELADPLRARSAAAPHGPEPAPPGKEWPALRHVLEALAALDPELARAVGNSVLPQPNKKLGAALTFLLSALRNGDARGWLGEEAASALERSGQTTLLRQMEEEFRAPARAAAEAPSDWKPYVLPMLDNQTLQAMEVYVRPPDADEGRSGGEEREGKGNRFVFEVTLSRFGPLQLDGLVRPQRFDLILRSHAALPAELQSELTEVFANSLGSMGFSGALAFQTGARNWVKLTRAGRAGLGVTA